METELHKREKIRNNKLDLFNRSRTPNSKPLEYTLSGVLNKDAKKSDPA